MVECNFLAVGLILVSVKWSSYVEDRSWRMYRVHGTIKEVSQLTGLVMGILSNLSLFVVLHYVLP